MGIKVEYRFGRYVLLGLFGNWIAFPQLNLISIAKSTAFTGGGGRDFFFELRSVVVAFISCPKSTNKKGHIWSSPSASYLILSFFHLVDALVGVPQQTVGKTALEQVHRQEGRLFD